MFTLYIIEGEEKNNGHKFIKKHEGFPAIHVHSPIAEPRFLADLSLEKNSHVCKPNDKPSPSHHHFYGWDFNHPQSW